MVLAYFFTLTEMKDGLASLARIDELVSVMRTSDCNLKGTGDAAREWSTVATVLAATENKDYLNRFIQSDGLQFLNQWLQVAQKCKGDTSDSFVEESIAGLLGALEKLPIDKEHLTTCGIRETIEPLLTYKSFNVQDKARSLFDSWNKVEGKDSFCQSVNKGGTCCDGDEDDPKLLDDMTIIVKDGCAKSSIHEASPIKEAAEGSVSEHSKPTRKDDDSQLEIIEDVKITTSNRITSPTSSKVEDVNGNEGDVNSSGCSLISNSYLKSSGITEQFSLCPVEVTTSVGTCSSLVPGDQNLGDKSSDVLHSYLESSGITEQFSLCPIEVTTSVGTRNSLVPGDHNLGDKSSDVSHSYLESSRITEQFSVSPVEVITSVGMRSSLVPGDQNPCDKSSDASHSHLESSRITEQFSLCPVEVITSVGACSSLVPGYQNLGDKSSDVSLLKDRDLDDRSSDDYNGAVIEMAEEESSEHSKKEKCSADSNLNQLGHLSAGPANAESSMTEPAELFDMDVESLSCTRKTAFAGLVDDQGVMEAPANAQSSMTEPAEAFDMDVESLSCPMKTASAGLVDDHGVMEAQIESETVDCGMPKHSINVAEPIPDVQDGKCHAMFLQDLTNSGSGCISRKSKAPKASSHRKESFRTVADIIEHVGKPDLYAGKGADYVISHLKPTMVTKKLDEVDGTSSEVESDYGLDDALEVARRVAKEVEREVADYRGPFCSSSSEKTSEGEIMQPNSHGSVECNHDESMIENLSEDRISVEKDLSDGGSSHKTKHLRTSSDGDYEADCPMNTLELCKTASISQEIDDNNHERACDFDLNEDVNMEEVKCSMTDNQPISVSAPIPVAAASRGSPLLPSTPFLFEGEMGWRGSATTSAFRRASPRRTPDREKTSLFEGSSNSSKQRQNLLKIDLNVAEDADDLLNNLASSAKQVPVSSGLHSGDSSVEVSSAKAERFKLDLNRIGDCEDATTLSSSVWKENGQLFDHKNGKRGQSAASSSSSRWTSMRDFDLNDNPSFFDACGSHDYHQFSNDKAVYENKNAYRSFKLDDPVVSIMGSKINVSRKEFVDQYSSFLTNGLPVVSTVAAVDLVRAGAESGAQPPLNFPPMQHSTHGYNGLVVGSTMSLHPQLYGAPGYTPYLVDSRGSTVTPQILGSSSADSQSSGRPIMMSALDAPLGSNGAGFFPAGLDLNSVATSVAAKGGSEMGTLTLRQLFVQEPGNLMEEQMRSAGAGMTLKRKEPECAWEWNMFGHKQGALWR